MNQYRNLMVYAVNAALSTGRLSLNPEDDRPEDRDPRGTESPASERQFVGIIAGKQSIVEWSHHGWDEVSIRLRWDLCDNKHGCRAILRCWLERRNGKHLQGHKTATVGRDYVCRSAVRDIKSLDVAIPNGYEAGGRFYL